MSQNKRKKFLTYQQQIELLKSKKLTINNEQFAIQKLKEYSYYSLISGYKDIFKVEKNGDYKSDATFEHIVTLYIFDDVLRNMFLHQIIKIEKKIKSLYSYSFCELYGDKQSDYLNVTNYNYSEYQNKINEFTSIAQDILTHPNRHAYINYNIQNYGTVPLWVLIHTLTLGNVSKMYEFSYQKLQSRVAREFDCVYGHQLKSMLNVLSKFRNVCAHGERLYNYKTRKSISDLPIHDKLKNYNSRSKNDLFNIFICFKYLLSNDDFNTFAITFENIIETTFKQLGSSYATDIMNSMGFPENWKDVITLDK